MIRALSSITSRVIQSQKLVSCQIRNLSLTSEKSGIYEPPYLNSLKPEFPVYDTLNVRITGYDFPLLESYQRFVHRIAEALNLDVSECWAHPPKHTQILRYKPNSAVVDSEYKLTTYERYVQVSDIQAPTYPLFLRFIQSGLPEGVTLKICHHTEDIEEARFVPDKDLLELKAQLNEAGGPISTKKK
ncbi:unnamed protein product [Diamesa hyperborea]